MKFIALAELESYPGPYPGMLHHVIANKDTGFDNFEIIYSKLPKGAGAELHNHPHSEKFQFVLEGSLEVRTPEGEVFQVPAGTGVLFPPAEYHDLTNTYDGTTTYLVFYSPGR